MFFLCLAARSTSQPLSRWTKWNDNNSIIYALCPSGLAPSLSLSLYLCAYVVYVWPFSETSSFGAFHTGRFALHKGSLRRDLCAVRLSTVCPNRMFCVCFHGFPGLVTVITIIGGLANRLTELCAVVVMSDVTMIGTTCAVWPSPDDTCDVFHVRFVIVCTVTLSIMLWNIHCRLYGRYLFAHKKRFIVDVVQC